ncbi:MAG: outer membrane beta-barrel protein [Pseudolabrys sp.]
MSRSRPSSPVLPRGARLVMAACVAMWSAGALAQTPPPLNPDPLAPKLQTDSRNLPRFQKFTRPSLVQLGPPAKFTVAPASGAGITGFDSTNSRKKAKPRAKAKSPANAQANEPANPRAIAPGLAEPITVSPYQKPVTDSASGALAAAPPGAPPVELGPIRRAPEKRRAHEEPEDPYAPVGVRASAFTLFPSVELIGGYDNNPSRAPGGSGASLYTVAPELQVRSNWSRHEFKADLRGSYTGYSPDETPTLSRPYFSGKLDGRVDVTHDTRIDLNSRLLISTDSPNSPNLQAGLASLPVFTTMGGSVGLGQKFNRLDLSLKGDVERTAYQDSSLVDGSTANNADRNYNQYTGKLRGGYELSPGVMPYVELDLDTRHHDLDTDFSGYQRDSKGVTGLVGTTFKLANLLTGDIGLGYETRSYEDPRFARLSGLVGNGSLIYTASALTTVKLNLSSVIQESTVPGVSGVLSRDLGLQVDHSLRRWLIATFKAGIGIDDYKGIDVGGAPICDCVITTPGDTSPDREDHRYYVGTGLTYKLTRSVQIKSEFRHEWLHSNVAGNDYTASVFLVGLRLQR